MGDIGGEEKIAGMGGMSKREDWEEEIYTEEMDGAEKRGKAGTGLPHSRLAEGVDDFAGGVGAGSAGEAVAGMRAGAAEKKATDGRFVAGPIEDRTHGEELIQGEFAVKDVAAGESVAGFEVVRSDDLHVFDEAREIGGVLSQSFDDGVAEIAAAGVPIGFGLEDGLAVGGRAGKFEGRKLDVSGEDVLAVRSERRIENRRKGDVQIRRGGKLAVFGGIEGALEIIEIGPDVNAAGESFESVFGIFERRKCWQAVQCEIDFGDGAIGADVANAKSKSGIELRRIEEFEEGALGVDAGDHGRNVDFLTVGKYEAADGAIFHADVLNLGVGTDFHARIFCGLGEGVREGAQTAARKRDRKSVV